MMMVKDMTMDCDNFSCIKEITKNVPITLSTAYQGSEITGISNVLDSWKCQYIQQLQGIVVNYKNVSLMSKYAYIKSDYPVIHCNVKATFELFIPVVGSIVKGKVNRISHDYIGCLVHNTINVAINRTHNEYDSVSNFITLDQIILFEITHIGFKRKIIRVKGKISRECINLMKDLQLSNVKTESTDRNLLTSSSRGSDEDTASEELEDNFDRDSGDVDESQSLLCNNGNLFIGNVNIETGLQNKKKKKSDKFQSEQSSNRQFGTSDMEEDASSGLSCNNAGYFTQDSRVVNHDSPKTKKKKSNSPKTKKKKSNKVQTDSSFNRSFDTLDTISDYDSTSLLSQENTELLSENSMNLNPHSHSSKRKKKKSKEKLNIEPRLNELPINSPFGSTLASSYHSPKKKKSKQLNNSFPNESLTAIVKEEHSTDTSSHLSSSSKKKKRRKSKAEALSSPPLFSDSLSSNKDEIEPFKVPKSPSKKKRKLSQDTTGVTDSHRNFISALNDNILTDPLTTSICLEKTSVKSEDFDHLIKVLSPFDPSFENNLFNEGELNAIKDKSLGWSKKGKKRMHESPDKDGLPKKKKKTGEKKSEKNSIKHKSIKPKKKSKEKSARDSKREKKKSKKRIISSKKKLPKLKKKRKDKGEKLNKKLKKSSKHK